VKRTPHRGSCWLLSALLATVLGGCHGKTPPPSADLAATSTDAQTDTGDDDNDPCSLLAPKEVEAVLGAPLAVSPFRSTAGPDDAVADGGNCVYETADFHYLEVAVDFDGGARSFSMVNFTKGLLNSHPDANMAKSIKRAFKLDDGTELSGEWDEATLTPLNCCIFNALRADQMITVDFTATRATLAQAATLVDAAFKRIDKPLNIDGNAGVAPAHAYVAHRIKPVDPCTLLTRAEVEAIIGRLVSDPVASGTDSCAYELPAQGIRRIYQLNFTWRGGYYKYRSDSHVAGATGGILADATAAALNETRQNLEARVHADEQAAQAGSRDTTKQIVAAAAPALGNEAAAPSDAWEQAEIHGMAFAAVKKDVLVSVDLRGVDRNDARKLVEAVMRKI